jgi:hypothetical protein
MAARRPLSLSPDNESFWMGLYPHEIGGIWTAMLAGTPRASRGRARADAPGVRDGRAGGRAGRTARARSGL